MAPYLGGTQYGVSQNVTRNNAKIKFLVDQEAFSVILHPCIADNAIAMLVIYHFYDWTWSFCYCAYSNTFLSSLSSLYLLFNCINIVNLLHYRNCLFFMLPLLPICCRIASEWPTMQSKIKIFIREMWSMLKNFCLEKNFIALLECREDQNFEAHEFIHKNEVCKGSEVPWEVLKKKVSCGNFGSRRRLRDVIEK